MLTEYLLCARCCALFILQAKQKVDLSISMLQMGTLKLLDIKSAAESHKNSKSGLTKCRAVNSQSTLSIIKHYFPK